MACFTTQDRPAISRPHIPSPGVVPVEGCLAGLPPLPPPLVPVAAEEIVAPPPAPSELHPAQPPGSEGMKVRHVWKPVVLGEGMTM